MLCCAAIIGLLACTTVQGLCFDIPTEANGRPQPGTPRAAYCGPIDHWYRWLMFPAAAAVMAVVTSLVLARISHRRAISLGVLVVLAVANLVVVNGLDFYVEI
jgi:hypothetical protein